MSWKPGRGLMGPLKPLIGRWKAEADMNGQTYVCTRGFEPLGKGWIRMDAVWDLPGRPYSEVALFGPGDDGQLGVFSFTSDGKRSVGSRAEASDVHPEAVAFEARMPAGLARMVYWPAASGPGFRFAVESRNRIGWNRFLVHDYAPAA